VLAHHRGMKPRTPARGLLDLCAWLFLVAASALTLRAALSLGRIACVLATGHEPPILSQVLGREEAVAGAPTR
jgi:hypothetical protein